MTYIRLALLVVFFSYLLDAAPEAATRQVAVAGRPVSFEENRGQFGPVGGVAFTARADGYRLELRADGVSFVFADGHRVGMQLGRKGRWSAPVGDAPLVMRSNYLRSADSAQWVTGARHFQRAIYRQVYPGIDLQFSVTGRSVEYDFLVAAGADPAGIELQFPGASALRVEADGDLVVGSGGHAMRHRKPVVYQGDGVARTEIPAAMRVEGQRVRFAVGPFRRDRALVIDPVVEASTLLGGGGEDFLLAVAADAAGNMYVTGSTESKAPLPLPVTAGVRQGTIAGGVDAFVAKISPDGKTFLYVTYLGGSADDKAESIAVDGAGNVVVTGWTRSLNFPVTAGVVQASFGDLQSTTPQPDAFVTKLDSTGSGLLFSTYLGREGIEWGRAVRLDANGNIYVAGSTTSPNFVTTAGAYQRTMAGSSDVFVVKLNPSGTARLYSTFFGGASGEDVGALAVDGSGAVVIGGRTESSNLAIVGPAVQTPAVQSDAYLTKLNAAGSGLVFSNYLGAGGPVNVKDVELDATGNITVGGHSGGSGFPVTLPAPGVSPEPGPFIAKVGPGGGPYLYSRVLACGVNCQGSAIAVEPSGIAYWTGAVFNNGLPLAGEPLMPFQQFNALASFLARVGAAGEILDNTYWYGSGTPAGFGLDPGYNSSYTVVNGLAVVSPGVVVMAGDTTARRFPTTAGAAQTAIAGTPLWDTFVTKISYVSSCTYALSTEAINAPAGGSSTVVNVTTAPGCPWVAMPSDEWVSVQVLSASQIRVTVAPSTMISRGAGVFVGGKTIYIQQGSGCNYSVREAVVNVPASGAFIPLNVDTGFACPWTLTSDVAWIPVSTGSSAMNSGSQSTGYNVLVNQYPTARTGTLTIAPGVTVSVQQAASPCTYSVDPLQVTVSAQEQMPTVAVTTQPGCRWLKEEGPSWLYLPSMVGNEGTGSGAANLFFFTNQGPTRTGTVRVAGKLVTVTQMGTALGTIPDVLTVPGGSYTANPQAFSFGGRDGDGLANLSKIHFLVHTVSAPGAGVCYGYYDVGGNMLYLYDDAGTAPLGPLAPGAAGTLQNSQCSVSGAAFSRDSVTSDSVYLTLGITRLGSYASGAKTLYLLARDKDGNDKGWQAAGNWNPIGNAAVPPSVVPAAGTYTLTRFTDTITARDGNGFADLKRVYFLMNAGTAIAGATCHGFFERATNELFLYNDALTGFVGSMRVGENRDLRNSQCAVSVSGSNPVRGSGTDLVIDLNFEVLGSYGAVSRKLYALAQDNAGTDGGWVELATVTIAGAGANQAPTVVSATPVSAVGSPQSFVFTGRDANGFADIARVYFLVNADSNVPGTTCHGFYDRAARAFFLYDDGLARLLGPLGAFTAGPLGNSQCVIDGSLPLTATGSGSDLTLQMTLQLRGTYATQAKKVYWWAVDAAGLGTGWVQTGTWAPGTASANQPPAVVSATPANAVGTPQSIALLARDPNGFPNINRVYFLVNGNTSIPANTCHGFWDRATGGLYLYSDGLTTLQGPLTPGGAGTLTNGQCTLTGATSTPVSGTGNDLTVTLGLGLKGSFGAASQNVYFWVVDAEANGTGWVQTGTWGPAAVAPSQPPVIVSMQPASAVGSPQTFTTVARDPNGFANLQRVYFLVNPNTNIGAGTCHGFYDRGLNAFYLYDDALTVLQGPLAPGGAGSLSNGQCAIQGAGSTMSGAGTDLTLTMAMRLNGTFGAASKNVYLWAVDAENNGTGWVQMGTWAPAIVNVNLAPVVVSGSPANAAGAAQTFSFLGRDGNGFANIQRVYFLVNTNNQIPQGTCHGFYDRAANAFYLYNDALTALEGPLAPGAAGVLQNGQCLIRGADSTPVTGSGTDLTVTLGMTLKAPYSASARNVYAWVQDVDGNGTGWVQTGSWNAGAANVAPAVVVGAVGTVAGSPQTVAFTARDGNGAGDVARLYFVVSPGAAQVTTSGCHGFYDRASNSLFLYDDGLGALAGPLVVGTAGTIQNSQCAVEGAGTSVVSATGTDFVLGVQMRLRGGFAGGAKKLYLLGQDKAGADSGWVQVLNWNP